MAAPSPDYDAGYAAGLAAGVREEWRRHMRAEFERRQAELERLMSDLDQERAAFLQRENLDG